MGRGFYLAVEALVSMMLLALILALPVETGADGYMELHIMQKQDDLLKVWLAQGGAGLDAEKRVSDFEFVFPGRAGILVVGGSEIKIGDVDGAERRRMRKLGASAHVLDDSLNLKEILIAVYY